MSVKPSMLKDEFTEKYFEEDNVHNKELFNPTKAASSTAKKIRLPATQDVLGGRSIDKRQSDFFLPK